MHKIVATVFKTIGITIVLMVLAVIVSFLLRFSSMESKMKSITATLYQDISNNNYLTETSADMYIDMLDSLQATDNELIMSWDWNYVADVIGHPASSVLSDIGAYGDTKEIVIIVTYYNPVGMVIDDLNLDPTGTIKNRTVMTREYRYTVPCLRYVK